MLDLTTGAVGPPISAARRVACRVPGLRAAAAAPANRLLAEVTPGLPPASYRPPPPPPPGAALLHTALDPPLEGAADAFTFDPAVDGMDSAIWNNMQRRQIEKLKKKQNNFLGQVPVAIPN